MLAGLFVHAVAYVAVSAMLVVIWALGETGSFARLGDFVGDPDSIKAAEFWPIWVLVTWGAAVVVHGAFVVAFGLFGRRRRRERRAHRERMIEHARTAAELGRDAVESVFSGSGAARVATAGPTRPERQWVTVMFTDLVDSTHLTETLGDVEWSRVLRAHRDSVRRSFTERDGSEVSTAGDGFLVRFDSPADAVLCAIDIQREMVDARGAGGVVPSVRIGIHAGEAVEDDGDLVGRVVNLASRVAGEAQADEILVTEPVADYVGGRISLEDRGVRELKGFSQPRHLLSVRWDGADEVSHPHG